MVFTCDKVSLQDALALAGRAVSTRATNPILECVLVTAEPGVGVSIIGNDKEIFIETASFPAEVEVGGSIALDAKLFTEIVRRISGDSVVIETDDSFNAICKSGRSRLKIAGQPPEEFPVIPENELSEVSSKYKIRATQLKNMIKQTIFSVAMDQTKPILTGEKLEIKNNVLEMVAIDMFRISYSSADMGEDAADSNAVVPAKALGELSRILPDTDDEVNFFFTQNKAVFETGGFRLVSSLLAGEFIRYDQIYNEDFSTMLVADRVSLLNAFERAVLVASEGRMLPVQLNIADDDITISAQSERGQVDDGVPCETEGKDLTIYFNPKYFIDVLRALEEERVVIKFNTVMSPCTIRGSENENGLRYLIVPLRPPA
ncbi:MAG: DNA polymerase III subunit beta [Defluviitaleaceae bacterium]|nr:DNA polymerase III subunit beta [Defluviitaleaceae bacterium]MCL2263363.1 DNA polymerase III subunit beta [Defluviitaleaceae bacterium]